MSITAIELEQLKRKERAAHAALVQHNREYNRLQVEHTEAEHQLVEAIKTWKSQ